MKNIEQISVGTNYSAASIGAFDKLGDHSLPLAPGVEIIGKVFVGDIVGATGAELSFQIFEPGGGVSFLHSHRTHEELYIFVKGSGEFQVDGEIFQLGQGTVVRVAPNGRRSLRNTGSEPLVMICAQYKADSFDDSDKADGIIEDGVVVW